MQTACHRQFFIMIDLFTCRSCKNCTVECTILEVKIDVWQNVNWMKNILIFQKWITQLVNICYSGITFFLGFSISLLLVKPRGRIPGQEKGREKGVTQTSRTQAGCDNWKGLELEREAETGVEGVEHLRTGKGLYVECGQPKPWTITGTCHFSVPLRVTFVECRDPGLTRDRMGATAPFSRPTGARTCVQCVNLAFPTALSPRTLQRHKMIWMPLWWHAEAAGHNSSGSGWGPGGGGKGRVDNSNLATLCLMRQPSLLDKYPGSFCSLGHWALLFFRPSIAQHNPTQHTNIPLQLPRKRKET